MNEIDKNYHLFEEISCQKICLEASWNGKNRQKENKMNIYFATKLFLSIRREEKSSIFLPSSSNDQPKKIFQCKYRPLKVRHDLVNLEKKPFPKKLQHIHTGKCTIRTSATFQSQPKIVILTSLEVCIPISNLILDAGNYYKKGIELLLVIQF